MMETKPFELVTEEFWAIVDDPKNVRRLFWFTMGYFFLFSGDWQYYWGLAWASL